MAPELGSDPWYWRGCRCRFFNGVVHQDPRNVQAVATVLRSGLPACIVDDELAARLEPQERKYLRYRYALCVSRLLVRLGSRL